MEIKKILKTYTFWLAVASGLFLLVQFACKCFGFEISREGYMSAINGILGVFVMAGILIAPPEKNEDETTQTQNETEEDKTDEKNNQKSVNKK